jgi:hypothetical protein
VGLLGIVFAVFTVGYMLGVWTSALIFRQQQPAYEDSAKSAPRRRLETARQEVQSLARAGTKPATG